MRPDFARDLATCPNRRADDDQIGSGYGRGIGFDHLIGKPKLGHTLPCPGRTRGGHDLTDCALRPRGSRNRGADEAHAEQRQSIEERGGCAFFCHSVTPVSPRNP
jgi:hypothetical protein